MLIAARYLVDRVRHTKSRADDLRALRTRFASAAEEPASLAAIALARRLRELREELHAALAGVDSCSGCAKGHPLPHGRWDGGHCCGCRTEQVFTDDEIVALHLAGTSAGDLHAPASDHAGCAFRGPTGCSLEVADRPSICVRYTCRQLEAELDERGMRRKIARLQEELRVTLDRFAKERASARGRALDPFGVVR